MTKNGIQNTFDCSVTIITDPQYREIVELSLFLRRFRMLGINSRYGQHLKL